jgi:glycine/D-amino acid oxidase-like deaminating enzyme
LRDHFKLLRVEECNERVRVTNVQGGLYTREGASLHPGRLVRGLAAVVERRGGAIYENTDVTEVRSGSDARLITPTGKLVRAKRAILLAGEAYLTRLRQYHRSLLPQVLAHQLDRAPQGGAVESNRLAKLRESGF